MSSALRFEPWSKRREDETGTRNMAIILITDASGLL